MATTRRTGLALLLASGLAAATLPLAMSVPASASPAPAAATSAATSKAPLAKKAKKKKAKITLSSSTVKVGQTVTVKGSGYPKKATLMAISVCKVPVGEASCNHAPGSIKQFNYKGKGKFKTKFKFKKSAVKFQGANGKMINCKKVKCVVGTVNMYNFKDARFRPTAPFRLR